MRLYSGSRKNSRFTLRAWNRYDPVPSFSTITPIARNRSISLFTSTMSGTLWMVTGSLVSSTAQRICSASFLAPWGTTSPLRRWPPTILKLPMVRKNSTVWGVQAEVGSGYQQAIVTGAFWPGARGVVLQRCPAGQ